MNTPRDLDRMMTYKEIAKVLGISKSRVQQIEAAVFKRIREAEDKVYRRYRRLV